MKQGLKGLLSALLLLLPAAAPAATVNIGIISFDIFIPGTPRAPGVNVFDISNFTGDPALSGFALPPDFPVLDSLSLLNSSLTVTSGGSPRAITLGTLAPGNLSPTGPVQFPDTTVFTSASFTGTLSRTTFRLSDGSTFLASPTISARLVPASGPSLVAGTDFVILTAISAPTPSVPEPATAFLLGGALTLLIGTRIVRKHV